MLWGNHGRKGHWLNIETTQEEEERAWWWFEQEKGNMLVNDKVRINWKKLIGIAERDLDSHEEIYK